MHHVLRNKQFGFKIKVDFIHQFTCPHVKVLDCLQSILKRFKLVGLNVSLQSNVLESLLNQNLQSNDKLSKTARIMFFVENEGCS